VADLRYHALPEVEKRLEEMTAEIEAKRGDAAESGREGRKEGGRDA